MKYYTFEQNNSGGRFQEPAGTLIVQAVSYEDARSRAEGLGVYFDGCEQGLDCSCCGDRWREDKGIGYEVPTMYEESLQQHIINNSYFLKMYIDRGVPSVMVYHYDGTKITEHVLLEPIDILKEML